MLELVLYYVLPNVALFGGIYMFCKFIERSSQDFIDNYDLYQQKLVDFKQKLKYK